MEELKYEDNLWGKVEFLHERYKKKNLHASNFIEIITKFQNACINFSKSLSIITNKNYQLLEEKTSSTYKTIESLLFFINLQSQEYNELFRNIKSNILEPTTKLLDELNHKEKELYILYTRSRTQYNNSKVYLDKVQKDYENSVKLCEKVIHNSKTVELNSLISNEDKEKSIKRVNTSINASKNLEDKYFICIEEANKMRTNNYAQEKEILKFYETIDYNNYNEIKGMIGVFLVCIKKMYKSIFNSIEILSNDYVNLNIVNDLNEFIQNNKSSNKPDDPIEFIPYVPEANLKTTSISGDPKENEILHINFEVISTLRNSFRNICKELNMEEETKKHRLRLLSSKIFKIGPNVTFNKEEKDELISLLKIPEYRNYFIITLSKQRTKGRFQRGERLLEDLADILKLILDMSENEKNYEDAKNCIILSQTFYSEIVLGKNKKEKYKRYLIDYIVDNSWLTSISFWEGIIDYMIQKEIKKNEEFDKETFSKETVDERRLRISNIAFSQLLSYTNNMIDFYIKKDLIIDLVDLFVKKYDIEKSMADMVYDNIKNTPEKKRISFIKKKNNLTLSINRIKRCKSLLNKKIENINVSFEVAEKKSKKILSVPKFRTILKLEESKFKYERKNNLVKKFKSFDISEERKELNSISLTSREDSQNIEENKLDLIKAKSHYLNQNNIYISPTVKLDINDMQINIDNNNNNNNVIINENENININMKENNKNNEEIIIKENIPNDTNQNNKINIDNKTNTIINNIINNNINNDINHKDNINNNIDVKSNNNDIINNNDNINNNINNNEEIEINDNRIKETENKVKENITTNNIENEERNENKLNENNNILINSEEKKTKENNIKENENKIHLNNNIDIDINKNNIKKEKENNNDNEYKKENNDDDKNI